MIHTGKEQSGSEGGLPLISSGMNEAMNKSTVWQRLNTAQVILFLLLFLGVIVVAWLVKTNSDSADFKEKLTTRFGSVRSSLSISSDAVRGLLLQAGNESERKRFRDAEAELLTSIGVLSEETRYELLTQSAKQFRRYLQESYLPFSNHIMELLNSNPDSALDQYNRKLEEIRTQRDRYFKSLEDQVVDAQNSEAKTNFWKSIVGVTCAVVLFLSFAIVAWLQSVAMARPLNVLVSSLDRMRQGDFTERVDMDHNDEFGILGDGLNRVADDLSELVGQVQRSGIRVNMTTNEIAATAKEQQSTVNQIAATTAEIGATSKQISATSRELVKTMNEVNQVAEDTAQLANTGQVSITRMENNMRKIMDASSSITGKLSVLSEKTANINTVVTTITKVADQTNLLSLNAAIEAEKAGEYGLGFAVVAMEIRRLADQTAVATYDIEKMVKEMQSAVAAGVMGMDKFSEEVRRGVDEIRQVSTQLAQIIHQVQTFTPRFQTVNEGMHAQATGALQISETLVQLNEAAQQTAESLRQSNIAIEQLNEAAHSLQTSVARFKLES
jgi:methyl-accepting chemotaxis protein WspA